MPCMHGLATSIARCSPLYIYLYAISLGYGNESCLHYTGITIYASLYSFILSVASYYSYMFIIKQHSNKLISKARILPLKANLFSLI